MRWSGAFTWSDAVGAVAVGIPMPADPDPARCADDGVGFVGNAEVALEAVVLGVVEHVEKRSRSV